MFVAMTRSEETENLKESARMLNDTDRPLADWSGKSWSAEDAIRFRRLVRAWVANSRGIQGIRLEKSDRKKLQEFIERISVTSEPSGRLLVVDFYTGDTASKNFARLMTNSQSHRLRGPCARPECSRWFLSSGRGAREFCSRRCAATARQSRRRNKQREGKLRRSRLAIGNYPGRPARFESLDWKSYVCQATGVSKKFLTVAVREGLLVAPAG